MAVSLELSNNSSDCLVDTLLQIQRTCTCSNVLQTYIDNSLSENSSCGSTVTGLLVSLGSDFLDHLCTHIGESVFQLDFLSDSNTVLSYLRSTELLVDNDVTTFRSKCNLNCICESVSALFHFSANLNIEFNIFSHNNVLL